MYELVRSRYRVNRQSGRYKEADLANALVTTLTQEYGQVILYVTYAGSNPVENALFFDKVAHTVADLLPSTTVKEWLQGIGNQTLPFETELPNEKVRLVKYGQALHAGYKYRPVARFGHVDDNSSSFNKQDLLLVHPTHTPQQVVENCLVSVNGFYHISDWDENGVHTYNGNESIRIANRSEVGLTSFENVGKIKCIPITADMVIPQRDGAPLFDASYIKIPESVDLANKSILAVIGGNLHVQGSLFDRIGERILRVHLGSNAFLDQYFEVVQNLNVSSMGLEQDEKNKTLLVVEQLKSDKAVLAYLTLSQSFLVIVDTPSFFHEFEILESLRAPGRYMGYERKYYPLVGTYGRQLEYHIIHEHGRYVYATTRSVRRNYDANTRNWQEGGVVDAGCYPAHPLIEGDAFLRVMGTEG